jgi:hypothetical protein
MASISPWLWYLRDQNAIRKNAIDPSIRGTECETAHAGVGIDGGHRPEFARLRLVGVIFPGFDHLLTVLTLNLIGNWLRDWLDPKLRRV